MIPLIPVKSLMSGSCEKPYHPTGIQFHLHEFKINFKQLEKKSMKYLTLGIIVAKQSWRREGSSYNFHFILFPITTFIDQDTLCCLLKELISLWHVKYKISMPLWLTFESTVARQPTKKYPKWTPFVLFSKLFWQKDKAISFALWLRK